MVGQVDLHAAVVARPPALDKTARYDHIPAQNSKERPMSDNSPSPSAAPLPDAAHQAAILLMAARTNPALKLESLPEELRPADRPQAYAIQHLVAASFADIGGWKVGAAGPDAQAQCGALPSTGIKPSPSTMPAAHSLRGIEAEVCFRMGADLPPRGTPYTREEVIAAIATAHPVIETLDSRFIDPDAVDAFSGLADTQSHAGLIYGEGRADWHGIDFANETVEQYVNGGLHMKRTGNPVGDMIRLVVWMANEGAVWAGGLKAGQFVTCGSWTGKSSVDETARVRVVFPSLGDVLVDYV
jgi:2-keto-4-pentenoate hydratase